MRKKLILYTLLAIAFLTYSCKQLEKKEVKPSPPPDVKTPTSEVTQTREKQVVFRINGAPIYKEDLKGIPFKKAIMNEIFYQEGLRNGIDKNIEDKVEEYKRSLVIGKVTTEYLKAQPKLEEVTDEEMVDYYNKNIMKFQNLRIQEISVTDQKLAGEIRDRALTGEDLSKIASELSLPTRIINVNPDELTKNNKNMFKVIEKGFVSEVVKDGNEFKVLRIQDIKNYPLEKIQKSLTYIVIAHKKSQALLDYQDQLVKQNNINLEVLANE